jgi:hypothetical protein
VTAPVRFLLQGIAEGLSFSLVFCGLGMLTLYLVG